MPVMMKSSAYLTRCIFGLKITLLTCLLRYFSASRGSNPSNVILARVGEIIPPCGVPSSVGNNSLLNTKPHFNHFFSITLSIGILFNNHSWLIWSKHPLMSPSNTHWAECFFARTQNHCSLATAVLLSLRKP